MKLSPIGEGHGLVFDQTQLEQAGLHPGDRLNVEVQSDGAITVRPIRKAPTHEQVLEVIGGVMRDYSGTLRKLA